MKRTLLILATLLLYALHQDVWNWSEARPLVFGFLPIGLVYHAAYSVAASLLLWGLVTWAWPHHLEGSARRPEGGAGEVERPEAPRAAGNPRS
jgi:hypothetical protein